MRSVRCACCGKVVPANPRVKNQTHCGEKACQRDKKRLWQKKKMAEDCDYKSNQRDCVKVWRDRNPEYWKEYRKNHPQTVERNRDKQRERNGRRRRGIAKMESLEPICEVASGTYRLVPLDGRGIAKMEPLFCEITVIPVPSEALAGKGG